jgi:predicted membrane protein (TIGR00267 family)
MDDYAPAGGEPSRRRVERASSDGRRRFRHQEHHRETNWLRDVILGGQDGLVNILGIILGVIAGGGSNAVLLSAGFAAAITESISMGAVGYTSSVSERDYYEAERRRESDEIDTMMDEELHLQRVEMRDIVRTSFVIFIATLIGHVIPLAPFLALPRAPALITSLVLSALVLFGVGVYSALTLVGDWRRSGVKMALIGLGAAGIGFLIGRAFSGVG